MCVQLPCGYSSQTLTKCIAYCGITIYGFLISATCLLGLVLESRRDLDLLRKSQVLMDTENNSTLDSEGEFLFTSENTEDVISTTSTATVITGEDLDGKDDLMEFLDLANPIRTCFVLWSLLNFISGLIFSIVLLQGAQERNLFKVRIWFFATIITYLLWIPIYAYSVCHAVEPVNILCVGFMFYMLGGLCLWVVSGFIEQIRIESITHRVGYKDAHVPFYKI